MLLLLLTMMLRQVKAVSSRMERCARVVMTVGVVLGVVMVVVWESVFTPAAHVADDSNSTVSQTAEQYNASCRWHFLDLCENTVEYPMTLSLVKSSTLRSTHTCRASS